VWSLDWSMVEADDFEELVFQLLGSLHFSNRKWFRGASDRGRDITATSNVSEFEGRARTLDWTIECKRHSGSLSPTDLQASVVWIGANQPDRYLLVTSSWLTPGTKDWLVKEQKRLGVVIQYLEVSELDEQLQRYEPPKYRELLRRQIGSPPPAHQALMQELSGALVEEPEADPRTLRKRLAPLLSDAGERSPQPPAVSLNEVHEVSYVDDGMSHSNYRLTIANVTDTPVSHDTFRLYADVPIVANDTLRLSCAVDGGGPVSDIRYRFDNGYLKLIDFHFPDPLAPSEILTYSFAFHWPVPTPLEGPRHYSTFGRRPKGKVVLKIQVPGGYLISDVLPLAVRDGMSKRLLPHNGDQASSREMRVDYGPLRYREQLLTTFRIHGQ